MKFSELLERMRLHNEKLDEQFGEIMAEDEVEGDSLDNSLEWWTDYLVQRVKEAKSQADAARQLAAHYTDRAKQFDAQADYRKQGIEVLVGMAGKPVKTVAGTARIQEGAISVTVNCPPEMLPDEYKKVSYSADKAAIKRDLEAGKELNYAVLERGKPFLVIR